MRKIRGAIVGFGRVAAEAHVPGFLRAPGFEIVAVVDPAPEQLAAAGQALPGVHAYPDLAALAAAGEKIQFVDVATPPRFHAPAVADALGRGWHVLCEKPLALGVKEVEELRRAAKRSGHALFTVHNWKYAPILRRLHGLLRAGTIGEFREIDWTVLRQGPPQGAAEAGWRLDREQAGGGILMDHGWHAFYLMQFLTGRAPRGVTATIASERGLPVEDSADCEIDFEGVVAKLRFRWGGSERRTFGVVRGPLGSIEIEDDRLTVRVHERPEEATRFAPPISASSYHPEWFPPLLEDFRAEILQPDRRGRNLAEAIVCAELMSAAYASAGNRIELGAGDVVTESA